MRIFLAFLLVSSMSFAHGGTNYRSCYINSGRKGSCTHSYSGLVPIWDGDLFRKCKVESGRMTYCKNHAYSGPLVFQIRGLYRKCIARSGKISTCSSLYNGMHPVNF